MKSEDQEAAAALSSVDETATTQLRVLATLQAVVDVAAADGLVRDLVVRFREDRLAAFVRFHERTLDNGAGDLWGPSLERAWDEAIAFTIGVAGDGVEAEGLRQRKQRALSSGKPPRPFFARFLEQQKRS
ncbi:MAG: hypothetical protein Q8O67_28535 [Deltaproteobacteria bacterium]|nr:hypothetical protein [Deltaproteobacteria bacterium]